jgi:hypothetical protein
MPPRILVFFEDTAFWFCVDKVQSRYVAVEELYRLGLSGTRLIVGGNNASHRRLDRGTLAHIEKLSLHATICVGTCHRISPILLNPEKFEVINTKTEGSTLCKTSR